jgi:hypothetical protein
MRWVKPGERMAQMKNVYKTVVGKTERKRLLGRPRNRWEDITLNLREMRREVVECINPAQDRHQWWAVVTMETNFRVP